MRPVQTSTGDLQDHNSFLDEQNIILSNTLYLDDLSLTRVLKTLANTRGEQLSSGAVRTLPQAEMRKKTCKLCPSACSVESREVQLDLSQSKTI